MNTYVPIVVAALFATTSAAAQQRGAELDELVEKGWEPFSTQVERKFSFVREGGSSVELNAFAIFLRKKGGVAYCVKAVGGGYGFCEIISGKKD